MEGGMGGNATPERNRPGAATRGQQQPAVGHKSSKERPTRQGESSQHSAAAADGATGAGYPERGRERDRQKGKKGEARQANEGKCGRPAGQAVHAATNRGGRQQAPTPAWQPAGRAGSPHSLPGPAGSPPAVQASHIHGLHVYRQTLRLRSSACSRPPQQRVRDASAAPVPTLRAWHHRHTGNKHHRHHMLTPQSLCRLLSLLFSWHV